MTKYFLTKDGLKKLKTEISYLKKEKRPQISEAIAKARASGDLSENAEYHSAREAQTIIERKIQELENILSNAETANITNVDKSKISFGATVQLISLDNNKLLSYTLVGEYEADIKENTISITSPIALELIGKKEHDIIDVVLPNGLEKSYKITKITYDNF
ncbi:transcription elongation factor GreA [Candidatus Sneabacter namystus]|uniref:Transcription elongation factor GreA n=1 Tax=Candidatus Sneabacter namystus TaxID=2601646 RepID=A0A5C0UKN5_9RICK|nr:transcription elongation factor GreA [Candidatus Sneabacter namystus]